MTSERSAHLHISKMELLLSEYLTLRNIFLGIVFLLILNQLIELYQFRNMPPDEVPFLSVTNPPFNEQIWSVPSNFVKSRFHCIRANIRITCRVENREVVRAIGLKTYKNTSSFKKKSIDANRPSTVNYICYLLLLPEYSNALFNLR